MSRDSNSETKTGSRYNGKKGKDRSGGTGGKKGNQQEKPPPQYSYSPATPNMTSLVPMTLYSLRSGARKLPIPDFH
eukprot:TRINITY_DN1402_c0_g1_i1.p2 TRINITY_DN1402_c0_g1~~TRINITY_DN1402_c0_g1_i1.p2  ORF type:complete len:76 (-),score=7.33 TRINITY_DN1402_c0_g1_i1:66-293(-)